MALTTRDNLLTQASIDIPALSSSDNEVVVTTQERIDYLIDIASQEVIDLVGYNPIQDSDTTNQWKKTGTSYYLLLPNPVRTVTSIRIKRDVGYDFEDIDEYELSMLVHGSHRCIDTRSLTPDGSFIEINGRFGLADMIDETQLHSIQSAVHAKVWNYLFKEGIVRSTSQGSNTSTFVGETWMSEKNIRRIIDSHRTSGVNCV